MHNICIVELSPNGDETLLRIITASENPNQQITLILVARRMQDPYEIVLALSCSSSVEQVILLRCNIADDTALKIAEAAADPGSKTLLALALPHNRIAAIGASHLAKGLIAHAALHTLDLSFNCCGDFGAYSLSMLVRESPALRVLKLKENAIGSKGAADLASAIRCASLEDLDLSHNRMGDAGAQEFATALEDAACSLRAIDLACNAITSLGSRRLAAALRTNGAVESLRVLAISLRREEEAALVALERGLQSTPL
jgi:Ran GTPase-activating protein (RanGAP) involved in mRNA processing and transport